MARKKDDPRYPTGRPPDDHGVDAPKNENGWHQAEPTERLLERIEDVIAHSERHDHYGMSEVNACCTVDGNFYWMLLVAHGAYATLGHNPSEECDALEGPCACGAWHKWGEPR